MTQGRTKHIYQVYDSFLMWVFFSPPSLGPSSGRVPSASSGVTNRTVESTLTLTHPSDSAVE